MHNKKVVMQARGTLWMFTYKSNLVARREVCILILEKILPKKSSQANLAIKGVCLDLSNNPWKPKGWHICPSGWNNKRITQGLMQDNS